MTDVMDRVGLKRIIDYDLKAFDLPSAVRTLLRVDDLQTLVDPAEVALRTRETDQSSPILQRFYKGFEPFAPLYTAFASHLIAAHVREPVYIQRIPNLRFQPPGNIAVGEFHSDGDYNHPLGEINFWVPLTPLEEANTVWVETGIGSSKFEPIRLNVGELLMFDAVSLRHGNVVNSTPHTRVSIDFRMLPVSLDQREAAHSVNTHVVMAPGGYYEERPREPIMESSRS